MSWLPQQACRASSYSATARDWRADRRDLAFAPASQVTWAELHQHCPLFVFLNCVFVAVDNTDCFAHTEQQRCSEAACQADMTFGMHMPCSYWHARPVHAKSNRKGRENSGLLLLGCCCIYGAELDGPSCSRLEHGWRRQHCVKALQQILHANRLSVPAFTRNSICSSLSHAV